MFNSFINLCTKHKIDKLFPEEMNLYIAPPSSGKTSLASLKVKKALSLGLDVYSNVPIKGARVLDVKRDLGHFDLGKRAYIVIDEAGMAYDNRNFAKNFSREELEFFKLHRHYHTSIDIFSQGVDVDLKLRNLCHSVNIVHKTFVKGLIYTKVVHKFVDVDENTKQLIDAFEMKGLGYRLYWVRPAWSMFDSWDKPSLPSKNFPVWD